MKSTGKKLRCLKGKKCFPPLLTSPKAPTSKIKTLSMLSSKMRNLWGWFDPQGLTFSPRMPPRFSCSSPKKTIWGISIIMRWPSKKILYLWMSISLQVATLRCCRPILSLWGPWNRIWSLIQFLRLNQRSPKKFKIWTLSWPRNSLQVLRTK